MTLLVLSIVICFFTLTSKYLDSFFFFVCKNTKQNYVNLVVYIHFSTFNHT